MKLLLIFLILSQIALGKLNAESLYNLEGKEIGLEVLSGSAKGILFIWNTRCPFCLRELARLNKNFFLSKYKGITVFYVNIGDSKRTIERYAKRTSLLKEIREGIVLDEYGLLAERYSVIGIPTYIFLKDGEEVFRSFYLTEEMIKRVFAKDE